MYVSPNAQPMSSEGLFAVGAIALLVAGGFCLNAGLETVKARQKRSVPLSIAFSVMWGPCGLLYAGCYPEFLLVLGAMPFTHGGSLILGWLLGPFYAPLWVALRNRRLVKREPRAAQQGLSAMHPHAPGQLLVRHGDVLELDFNYQREFPREPRQGFTRMHYLVFGILAWVELCIWGVSYGRTGGTIEPGMMVFYMHLMFVPIVLLLFAAVGGLETRGFRARFDRAANTYTLETVQRVAGAIREGFLEDVHMVVAGDVPVRIGNRQTTQPGLLLVMNDGSRVPFLWTPAYPTVHASLETTKAALRDKALLIQEFLDH